MHEVQWPTPEEVLAAVDRSGHLLEQQVATDLQRLGWFPLTNKAWTDEETGKSREIDIWAGKNFGTSDDRSVTVSANVLVECKNTSAPYAFLTRPMSNRDASSAPKEFSFPIDRYSLSGELPPGTPRVFKSVAAFFYLNLDNHYWPWTENQRAVSLCRLDRRGGEWKADNSGVFDSLVYPLAKALESFVSPPRDGRFHRVHLVFPIVVLTSRLYCIDGTTSEPNAVATNSVRLQRELRSADLDGLYGMDFVQRDHFADFITGKVEAFAEQVASLFKSRPELASTNVVHQRRLGE